MSNKKKLIILLIPLLLILSGCGQVSVEYSGIWNFMVLLLARGIVFFGELFGNNLGWGIILMTLAIRLLLVPLYGAQIKSSEKMKAVQPKIQEINKKYEGKKTPDAQQKKSLEIQALYKENSINPLAGCLPALIQLPLLIAFYQAIQYLVPTPQVIEQLEASGEKVIYGLTELNAGKGEVFTTDFFGIALDERVIIFAFLAAASTFLSTYLSTIGQDESAPGSGMVKSMLYVMPLMIFMFGLSMPGAISIYWIVGNVVSILQTAFFKRSEIQTHRQRKKIEKK